MTDLAGLMRGTTSRHLADHFVARISLGVVRRYMYSAVVVGLNAVRRSSRHAEYKAQSSNGQGRDPMLHCYQLFLEVTT